MNFNGAPADSVEDEVGFNNQHAIAVLTEFRVSGNAPQKGMLLKPANPYIELGNKRGCSHGTVVCDELQYGKEVLLSGREIPEGDLSGHELGGGVSSSSGGE